MGNFFVSLIPRFVSNRIVIGFFELLRRSQFRHRKLSRKNLELNHSAYPRHKEEIRAHHGYVENQNAYADMRYGRATLRYSGCEILAVYNALYTLTGSHPIPLPRLIEEYESDGMVLGGRFGTSPKALRDFFQKRGYETAFTTREEEFEAFAREYDSLILTMYNNKYNILHEIHTVHIHREDGRLIAHNVYGNGRVVGPAATMKELLQGIHRGNARGISLLGIRRKEK